MNEHVRVEEGGGVLSITLNRPERRNAITVAMYAKLADALEQAANKPSVRVISFRGEGQDFAAGNDLMDFLEAARGDGEEIPVMRFLRALARCETPIVAAVHGNCVGIGTTMLLHCDLVIAEAGARFSMPFVDLGLVPEAASSLLLPWLAGRRLTARHLLLAEPFGVVEAEAMGIISHRAQKGQLQPELERIVQTLLVKPSEALRQTQRLLRRDARDRILERIKLESEIFAERLSSPEVAGAINAFFEKGKRGSNA